SLCTHPLCDVSRSDQRAEEQSERVHQNVSFASLDALGGIISNGPAVRIRLHALTVQNRRGGAAAFAFGLTDVRSQASVDRFPGVIEGPLPENMENGLVGREVGG